MIKVRSKQPVLYLCAACGRGSPSLLNGRCVRCWGSNAPLKRAQAPVAPTQEEPK